MMASVVQVYVERNNKEQEELENDAVDPEYIYCTYNCTSTSKHILRIYIDMIQYGIFIFIYCIDICIK